jgi:hypothetical protein
MKRPVGVTILGVLAIVAGVLGIVASMAPLGIFAFTGFTTGGGALLATVSGLAMFLGIVTLIVGVLQLAFGIGALMLKSWSWTLGIALMIASLVVSGVGLLFVGFTWAIALEIVFAGVVLYYLYRADVREAFGHGSHHMTSSTGHPTPA